MSNLALKDFEILSEQEQQEALALLDRYKTIEKQEVCQWKFWHIEGFDGLMHFYLHETKLHFEEPLTGQKIA